MCCQYYEFSHENVDLQPFWKWQEVWPPWDCFEHFCRH
jgi:hypothetical protein